MSDNKDTNMLEILNKIAATKKRTEKEAILESLTPDEVPLFQKVAFSAYDQGHNYWVKKYPRATEHTGELELVYAINQCNAYLTNRQVTGNKALEFLTDLDGKLSENDAEVLNRIIQRNLKCGATESTFNKIWPDLIYVHPYMRCSTLSDSTLAKLELPCFSQTKEDGQYVDIIVDEQRNVIYKSRTGEQFAFNNPKNDSQFAKLDSIVYMGEVLVRDEQGNVLPRTEGNGYLNGDDIDTSRLLFVLWDLVPLKSFNNKKCAIEYRHRFNQLKQFTSNVHSKSIQLVDTRVCKDMNEVVAHMQDNVKLGLEGIVIKNQKGWWADGTSSDQIKFKIQFDVELVVVGIEEGTNANKGKLGALVCESIDGLVKVDVGGGFSAPQRVEFFTEDMIGKIITCRANDIVQNQKDLSVYSLFLPRFIEVRTDKTEADTYEKILAQKDAFIDTLKVTT